MAEENKKAGRPKGSKNKSVTNKDYENAIGVLEKYKKIGLSKEEINGVLLRPHKCCCCGKRYVHQKGNFSYNSSDLYGGNNNYLPICNSCVEKEYNSYIAELGNELEAVHRVCLHWNMYFNINIYKMCKKQASNASLIRLYVARLNMTQYTGKTYDTYLLEQEGKESNLKEIDVDSGEDDESPVKPSTMDLFGTGYTQEEYLYLQEQYEDWTQRYECETKSQELIFKNISINDLMSHKAAINGDADTVNKCHQALSKLLADGNLKPSQNNELDNIAQESFGVLIERWEENEPIPEVKEEWKDVDNIKLYIEVFFLGHLCKMMKIKNRYSQIYDEYMAKYTVTKPEYDEDDELDFEDIFSGGDDDE